MISDTIWSVLGRDKGVQYFTQGYFVQMQEFKIAYFEAVLKPWRHEDFPVRKQDYVIHEAGENKYPFGAS